MSTKNAAKLASSVHSIFKKSFVLNADLSDITSHETFTIYDTCEKHIKVKVTASTKLDRKGAFVMVQPCIADEKKLGVFHDLDVRPLAKQSKREKRAIKQLSRTGVRSDLFDNDASVKAYADELAELWCIQEESAAVNTPHAWTDAFYDVLRIESKRHARKLEATIGGEDYVTMRATLVDDLLDAFKAARFVVKQTGKIFTVTARGHRDRGLVFNCKEDYNLAANTFAVYFFDNAYN